MDFMAVINKSMGNAQIAIEKFDGKKNFNLQKVHMKDILVKKGIIEAIDSKDNKPIGMTNADWD